MRLELTDPPDLVELEHHIEVPADAALGDLRDLKLSRLKLERSQLISRPAEHYPCTRRLAIAALAQKHDPPLQGLIWHSRQAELTEKSPEEVVILFGEGTGRTRVPGSDLDLARRTSTKGQGDYSWTRSPKKCMR